MSIYRGAGGAGDAVADSASEALLVRELAIEVQADADAASASATNAANSASSASSSASAASTSASNAATSATNAANSASSASTSATNAANSATAAQTAETAAELAETNAETAETNAAASASAASSSATTASTAATNASNSASAAATSATNASNSASAASTSASNASTSATAAASSASSASTSASNASTSATNAASSATTAATSATNAAASATAALASETAAASSASSASSSASSASTSASNAATSATNAANSASSASTSATNAANSATSAATSATNAAASATLAASFTPSQTGNAGKYLTTDGTNTSWDALATVANSGSYNDLADKPAVPTTLDSLTDVVITSPSTDQVLKYNGSGWVNGEASSAYNGMKNRIINGAMVIDQRNAGASVTPTAGAFTYTLDRWSGYASQASKYTVQQNAGSVTPPVGFRNYLGVTSSSAYAIGGGDLFMVTQPIEGFNVADLGWGTVNAATVTLSFWVRSSLTGTFGGSLLNSAATRSYPFTYTVSSANTWEQKSVTIAGETSGTWLTTNGIGVYLSFGIGVGSSFSGTAGAWANNQFWSATGATSVVGTNGATFYITGVQLEKGTQATSFEYRQYGQELALCQRYYEVGDSVYLQAATGAGGSNIVTGFYQVTKRATPTLTLARATGTGGGVFTNTTTNWSASAVPDGNGRIGWQAVSSAEL